MQQATRLQMQPFIQPISVDLTKEMAYFRAAFLKVEPRFDPKLTDKDILNSILPGCGNSISTTSSSWITTKAFAFMEIWA